MVALLKTDEKMQKKLRKIAKLLIVFLISFAIVLFVVFRLVPASPNVRLEISASQLAHHDVFVVPPGELEIEFHNDTATQCIFVMFPYANAGNIRTNFLKPIAPDEKFKFKKDVKENEAYGMKCAQGSLEFEWKDLPVLIVSGQNETLVRAEIKNGTLLDIKANARLSQVKVSPGSKLWFVIKNNDSNQWHFNIVVNRETVAKEGMPITIYKERYWPQLRQNQVLVLGPISFKQGIYLAGLLEHDCESCRMVSKFMIVSK